MSKQLGDYAYQLEQSDIDRVAVVRDDEGGITFKPEGHVHPMRFGWSSSCGLQKNPSVRVQLWDDRHGRMGGGGAMTHAQARALLAFLREHEHELTDDHKAGDIQEWMPN